MSLSPKTACLERPYFYGQWDGLSREVLLYFGRNWATKSYLWVVQWALPGSHPVQGVAGLEGKPGERQVDRPVVAFLKHRNSVNLVRHLRNYILPGLIYHSGAAPLGGRFWWKLAKNFAGITLNTLSSPFHQSCPLYCGHHFLANRAVKFPGTLVEISIH